MQSRNFLAREMCLFSRQVSVPEQQTPGKALQLPDHYLTYVIVLTSEFCDQQTGTAMLLVLSSPCRESTPTLPKGAGEAKVEQFEIHDHHMGLQLLL